MTDPHQHDPVADTGRLHDLLERTAPEAPDLSAAERTAAVSVRGRSARRRDRGLVAVGVAAVVAAGLGVPLALGGDAGDTRNAGLASEPAALVVEPCPSAPVDAETLGPAPALDDVVAVRSCPVTGLGVDPEPLPTAPLTDAGAEAFEADVAALPAYVLPDECALMSIMPMPWALQVQTSDGETFVLGSTTRLCSSVKVGGVALGSDAVIAAFDPAAEQVSRSAG